MKRGEGGLGRLKVDWVCVCLGLYPVKYIHRILVYLTLTAPVHRIGPADTNTIPNPDSVCSNQRTVYSGVYPWDQLVYSMDYYDYNYNYTIIKYI